MDSGAGSGSNAGGACGSATVEGTSTDGERKTEDAKPVTLLLVGAGNRGTVRSRAQRQQVQ